MVVRAGPWTLYHSGDTVRYEGMVERLAPFGVNLALLPINGRAPERRVAGNLWGRRPPGWRRHRRRAGGALPLRHVAFNTATPEEFVAECERLGQAQRVLQPGERLTLSGPGTGS